MCLYPRIIVSKSHGNASMYVDTVINFAKFTTYYIHTPTHTTYRMSDHTVSFFNKVKARRKGKIKMRQNFNKLYSKGPVAKFLGLAGRACSKVRRRIFFPFITIPAKSTLSKTNLLV